MHDVRMRGFQKRSDVDDVTHLIDARIGILGTEVVALHQASGRILAEDVSAPCAVPGFDRAAMDGYAVRGADTFGADAYSPLEFGVIGEAWPARPFAGTVGPGQAVQIMTGAPVPRGADAIAPAEIATESGQGAARKVQVREPIPPGRHVGRRGEDVEAGQVILRRGRTLRPQDVAALASVGVAPVPVIRRPRAAILITGDELLPPGSQPVGYRIVDSNSVMLAALLERDGAAEVRVAMVPDQYESVCAALDEAVEDVILLSGGSSVGAEDHAPRVLAELGELAVHGVALRPASPTGFGSVGGRLVFLLPGNPVSCLCAYDLFAGRAVRCLGGHDPRLPYPTRLIRLARKIVSMVGRVDYVRVQVGADGVEPLAVSGASLLSTTTRADGFVLVPAELEGFPEGAEVRVHFYDPQAAFETER
jgi:molybdopterin molybdotransferase